MRVMVLLKADKSTEASVLPSEQLLTGMGKFDDELVKAGVMETSFNMINEGIR